MKEKFHVATLILIFQELLEELPDGPERKKGQQRFLPVILSDYRRKWSVAMRMGVDFCSMIDHYKITVQVWYIDLLFS